LPDAAVRMASQAMRLSPQEPQSFAMQSVVALGHFLAGRDDEAYACAEAALRELPNFPLAAGVAAASAAGSRRSAGAANAVQCPCRIDPGLCLTNISAWLPFQRPEDARRLGRRSPQAGAAGVRPADCASGGRVAVPWRTGGF